MQVSKTELTALLKQVFEGLGFPCGEHEKAADMTSWLSMVGLGGLEQLAPALPYLLDTHPTPLQFLSEDETQATLDAAGGSTLGFADLATNLACVKALENEVSSVIVHNCHNRIFIGKALADCMNDGLHCLAYWRNGSATISQHAISARAREDALGRSHPMQFTIRQTQTIADLHKQSLFIHCSRDWQRLERCRAEALGHDEGSSRVTDPDGLNGNYVLALEHGISIQEDLWGYLQTLSQAVLVESSIQSRQGAGA